MCVCVCVFVQEVYRAAQGLLTKAREDKENGLTYIQSGWALIAAYISLGTINFPPQKQLSPILC